jgi:hypothetical protein
LIRDAATSWVYATTEDVSEHPEDEALLAGVKRLLSRTGREAARAVLARYEGGAATGPQYRVAKQHRFGEAMRGGARDTVDAVLARVEVNETPWSKTSTLFLDVEDAVVRLARRRAKSDPLVAAHLLVRAVLLTEGALQARDVDRLLEGAGGPTDG